MGSSAADGAGLERVLATAAALVLAAGLAALGQWLTSWYWTIYTFWCLAPYMPCGWPRRGAK